MCVRTTTGDRPVDVLVQCPNSTGFRLRYDVRLEKFRDYIAYQEGDERARLRLQGDAGDYTYTRPAGGAPADGRAAEDAAGGAS